MSFKKSRERNKDKQRLLKNKENWRLKKKENSRKRSNRNLNKLMKKMVRKMVDENIKKEERKEQRITAGSMAGVNKTLLPNMKKLKIAREKSSELSERYLRKN